MKTIILTLSAAKDIDNLPRDAREQVEAGLHRYAMTGHGDVEALQGRDGYRLRLGNYRVIFDEDATTILAIYIGLRSTLLVGAALYVCALVVILATRHCDGDVSHQA